ncbi:helix-turn-helix domain-containing protein [Micromonospora sp. WMMD1274]|uniref:helix-turn-helix domain-containing protein n=1 Tax=Micromonospora sp. WMMD1274 TaxID=3404116 RepID=UPI003B925406
MIDQVVIDLGNGQVVIGPRGVLLVRAALLLTGEMCRRDGLPWSQDFAALAHTVEAAARDARRFLRDPGNGSPPAETAPSAEARSVLVDPVTTAEAARIARVTRKTVRARCRRGEYASAVVRARAWLIERAEVESAALAAHTEQETPL